MDIRKEVVLAFESIPKSLEPMDFLERICLRVGVRREEASLAYRWSTDPASAAPRALMTDEDVRLLFAEDTSRKSKWRNGHRDVKIRIENLVCRFAHRLSCYQICL